MQILVSNIVPTRLGGPIVRHLEDMWDDPERLLRYGYVRRDQSTTDVARSVWFEKIYDSCDSQARLILQIEFDLSISDDPFATYKENLSYSFNGVYLRVVDRQMAAFDNQTYDEETERPRSVGRRKLSITTLEDLKRFDRCLG
jgi:hypothetical protein